MSAALKTVKAVRRRPIFGIFSIAFPLLGLPSAFALGLLVAFPLDARPAANPDAYPYWAGLSYFMAGSALAILLGLVSAAVALVRRERFRLLPILGIAGGLLGILFCFGGRGHERASDKDQTIWPQSSRGLGAPLRHLTVDSFRFIGPTSTMEQVSETVGHDDRDLGSGIAYYDYYLSDGSHIFISSVDGVHVTSVFHGKTVDGSELLFTTETDNPAAPKNWPPKP